jgi:hypothetical protein
MWLGEIFVFFVGQGKYLFSLALDTFVWALEFQQGMTWSSREELILSNERHPRSSQSVYS